MNIYEYAKGQELTAIYPCTFDNLYPHLGLMGEVGEVCDKIKKLMRDRNWDPFTPVPDDAREAIALELGDVLWYVIDHVRIFRIMLNRYSLNPFVNPDITWKEHLRVLVINAASLGCDTPEYSDLCLDPAERRKIIYNCIDALGGLARWLGYTLSEVAQMNIDKLQDRLRRGKIHGSGDYR